MSALAPHAVPRCQQHQQLLRRWLATQSHIMSGRLQLQQQQQQQPQEDGAPLGRRGVTTSAPAADGADADGTPAAPPPPPPPPRPSHHLPPEPPSARAALASAAARLLARCGVATATAGMVPRFTNPWPTWTGDKTFGEVLPFLRAMRERAPDGALEGVDFPSRADYARAFPLRVPDLEGFPPARDRRQQQQQQQSMRAQSDQKQQQHAKQQAATTRQQQQTTPTPAAPDPPPPPAPAPPPADVRAVWLGHACVLARLNGLTFLTDPALSERCSPLPFAGPRRVVPPALTVGEMPHVDVVLVSHNHYDHLDAASVRALHARFGPGGTAACPGGGDPLRWFVPLGLRAWFVSVLGEGVGPWVTELDWWEGAPALFGGGGGGGKGGGGEGASAAAAAAAAAAVSGAGAAAAAGGGAGSATRETIGNDIGDDDEAAAAQETRVVLVPAQHWSARGAFDRRATLWGGFCVVGPSARFYFAGDTGHCPAFKEIGDRLGPFDLAAIPTGAYSPRDFMRAQHIGPEEAVGLHVEVQAKASIAVHCCTWCLTLEPLDEPPRLLRKELARRGLSPSEFVTLQHGAGVRVVGGKFAEAPATLPVSSAAAAAVEGAAGKGAGAAASAAAAAAAAPASPSAASSPRAPVALRAEARDGGGAAPMGSE